jgi:polyphosphate kinase 2 (PPK2 family)
VAASGTLIVKVALMVSADEQKERLAERLERPDKHWKYNPGDIDVRAKLPEYLAAYQEMLDRTSTPVAPWYVVPADRKWYARLAVTELLTGALRSLDLGWPPADFSVEAEKARLAAS